MTRLGFLGAMNRDLVAAIPAATVLPDLAPDASPLVETAISDRLAGEGAIYLLGLGAASYLGGSAFNAARVAALLNQKQPQHDLLFFGIAGSVGGDWPHETALRDWAIDTTNVQKSALPPATCLAMVEPAGRTLLTAHGANADIAGFLRREHADLSAAMARCQILHITSYLDAEAPALIAELLAEARTINPQLIVSLDPGSAWIVPGGPGFDSLLAQTDILHLNNEEFAHFGAGLGAIANIGRRLNGKNWLIVARNHHAVSLYAAASNPRHLPDVPVPASVVDSTGAGDTFCGAFLWHFANGADALASAACGFGLARAKIATQGPLSAETMPTE